MSRSNRRHVVQNIRAAVHIANNVAVEAEHLSDDLAANRLIGQLFEAQERLKKAQDHIRNLAGQTLAART